MRRNTSQGCKFSIFSGHNLWNQLFCENIELFSGCLGFEFYIPDSSSNKFALPKMPKLPKFGPKTSETSPKASQKSRVIRPQNEVVITGVKVEQNRTYKTESSLSSSSSEKENDVKIIAEKIESESPRKLTSTRIEIPDVKTDIQSKKMRKFSHKKSKSKSSNSSSDSSRSRKNFSMVQPTKRNAIEMPKIRKFSESSLSSTCSEKKKLDKISPPSFNLNIWPKKAITPLQKSSQSSLSSSSSSKSQNQITSKIPGLELLQQKSGSTSTLVSETGEIKPAIENTINSEKGSKPQKVRKLMSVSDSSSPSDSSVQKSKNFSQPIINYEKPTLHIEMPKLNRKSSSGSSSVSEKSYHAEQKQPEVIRSGKNESESSSSSDSEGSKSGGNQGELRGKLGVSWKSPVIIKHEMKRKSDSSNHSGKTQTCFFYTIYFNLILKLI